MLIKLRAGMDRILLAICIALFAVMILVGGYQIAARYLFQNPSTISEELLTYSFAWMALFSASYVFGKREHMRMGFLTDRMGDKTRYWLNIGAEVLIFLFAVGIQFYGGIRIMNLTMSQTTASLGIPMGVVYLAVPLSGVLTAVYALLNMVSMIQKEMSKKGGESR